MKNLESIKQKTEQKRYQEALDELEPLLLSCEDACHSTMGHAFSFQHILESYYFDYFFQKNGDYTYAEESMSSLYRFKGYLEMHLGHPKKASIAYEDALKWNPVDLDAMLQLCELYKKMGEPEKCRNMALQSYNFCCTRASMSHFYRNLGYYYLELGKPELALALYLYSNIYYATKQADGELQYLKQTGMDIASRPLKDLQAILVREDIPPGPNPDTLGITYRVGCLEREAGHIDNARDCLAMVYDLTMDEETGRILEEL